MRRLAAAVFATLLLPAGASAQLPVPFTTPAARDTEPVVLTGEALGDWAVPQNANARLPGGDIPECQPEVDASRLGDGLSAFALPESCPHNHYAEPDVETAGHQPAGTPIDRLLGYRWEGRWVQIPFQVDEQFTRYLNNAASGFSPYSGEDQHTTYAYDGPSDREGFRWYGEEPEDPCTAALGKISKTETERNASDPVPGFDTNDEIAFMAQDAGPAAPAGTPLPRGIEAARQIAVTDPTAGKAEYVYVMRAKPDGPRPAFDADNGYVRYERDADANRYQFSQSSYDNYGNARRGKFYWPGRGCVGADEGSITDPELCTYKDGEGEDAEIKPVQDPGRANQKNDEEAFWKCPQRRRPVDTATITTDRFEFRYDGRWLMTSIKVRDGKDNPFGADLVDRWKARAFAQDPSSDTPCCGYEEEDTNWGGSSTLLGERVGPVRAIRETWGADSGTNVVRRETFYAAEMRQKTFLRVHVIPPLDGIYAQWDFNAGVMERFYNAKNPDGVEVDGENDEVFGNLDDPCNTSYDGNDTSQSDQGYREAYRGIPGLCQPLFEQYEDSQFPYHQSIDVADPTFSQTNAALEWSQTSGPAGTIIDRVTAGAREVTPGGTPQAMVAFPYYRDDSCFDDGTGTDPGPKLDLRSGNERDIDPATGRPRRCWTESDGPTGPGGDSIFYQGSIATHGMHIMFVVDSDNARTQMPVNEINAEQRLVMLPGNQPGSAGEAYGRNFEKPLVALSTPFQGGGEEPGPTPEPEPGSGDGNGGGAPGNEKGNQSANGNGNGQGNGGPREVAKVLGVRTAPTCASRPAARRVRPGLSRGRALGRLGTPTRRRGNAYGWCVRGGPPLVVVFAGGKARLVASGRRVAGDRRYLRAARALERALRTT